MNNKEGGKRMASTVTGETSPAGRKGWLQTLKSNGFPLMLALQGLGLFVLAFFLGTPGSDTAGDRAQDRGFLTDSQPVRSASETKVPTDLLPEQIRLPEFPDPDELNREQQPPPSTQDEARNNGLSLAALRIDTAAYQTPAPVQVALGLPDAPDQLAPGTISQARFGDGAGKRGRKGREAGWGGVGVGGVGIGRVGGGTCGRNPAGPNVIVERRIGFPR
jgi:hypothetical protein